MMQVVVLTGVFDGEAKEDTTGLPDSHNTQNMYGCFNRQMHNKYNGL